LCFMTCLCTIQIESSVLLFQVELGVLGEERRYLELIRQFIVGKFCVKARKIERVCARIRGG